MVWKFIAYLVTAYAALLVLLFVFQERLLFLPNVTGRALIATPDQAGMDFEDIQFRTVDGETLHGWWIPREHARGTLLFSHGNAGNISHRLDSIGIFHELGLNVFIYDYRGYGRSSGRPGEHGTYRDIAAAWDHLVNERGLDPDEIVLFGRSMGAAVSAWLAERESPAALILESTFTSVPELGQQIYRWLPVRWLARIRYDTRQRLGRITVPVMIVHSPDDEIIPYSHAEALFDAANPPRTLLQIQGDHNTGFLQDRVRYAAGLDDFLARTLDG